MQPPSDSNCLEPTGPTITRPSVQTNLMSTQPLKGGMGEKAVVCWRVAHASQFRYAVSLRVPKSHDGCECPHNYAIRRLMAPLSPLRRHP